MSTTIDDIECPNCGEFARREQDNRSGEVYCYCPECKWCSDNQPADIGEDNDEYLSNKI